MKKSLKHAILIFFSTATVLFIIFSPIFFKKDQLKNPIKNQVLAESDKKDLSENSAGDAVQVENRPENNSENKKESVNAENNNPSQFSDESEEIVKAPSVKTEQSSPTPVPSPASSLITNQTPTPQKLVTVEIQGLSNFQVELQENDTAFSVLLRTAQENNFTVTYQNYGGLGAFVSCIAGVCSHGNYYWAFYYNGQYSSLGASGQPVADNDTTSWKFED